VRCLCKKDRTDETVQCSQCKTSHHLRCVLGRDPIPENFVCPTCVDPHLAFVKFDTTRAAWRARYRVNGEELRCGGYYRCPYEAAKCLNHACDLAGIPHVNPGVGSKHPYRLKRNFKNGKGRREYEVDFVIDDDFVDCNQIRRRKRRKQQPTKQRRSPVLQAISLNKTREYTGEEECRQNLLEFARAVLRFVDAPKMKKKKRKHQRRQFFKPCLNSLNVPRPVHPVT